MSFLELVGLEKRFPGGALAVQGISLTVEEGEFVVLLGPSGCGKTTTLRMVAGLELPTAGRIHLAGREVTRLRPRERDVGFVFQFYALYPHLSARENIAFPLRCTGLPRAEVEREVDRVAARLSLGPLLGRRPRELSGGDQQRIALARAMVRRPAIFLMDEPLGTLDADRRLETGELLRQEQLALGTTTLYVTHDQEEALHLADRVVVMRGGSIEQVGTPLEVYDRPASLFVADFVGSPGMNLVPGRQQRDAAGASFLPTAGGPALELPRAVAAEEITLGVRPESVRIDPRGRLEGVVVLEEMLGAWCNLHVDCPCGRLVVRVAAGELRPRGTRVCLGLDPAGLALFATAGGERLL
jgi:multiple sugar transport system ATP-binding protein